MLMRNPADPSLGVGEEWGETPCAHNLLGMAWPQSSLEQKVEDGGTGNRSASLPLPCSPVGYCLLAAALVRRPGQAKAEKPGSME